MAQVWEDMKRTAQGAIDNIGNTYQQILMSGRAYPDQTSLNYEIAESAYQVNPEYAAMDAAYSNQEQERELWKGYEQYVDRQEPSQPQPQDMEPER